MTEQKKKKRSYTFRFNEDLVEKVRKLGDQKNRKLTNFIEVILTDYLHKGK